MAAELKTARGSGGLTYQPVHCTLPDRELILVLEGTATIEIHGGTTFDLKAGDIASIPLGAITTWHLLPDFQGDVGPRRQGVAD